jgi:hypothetical protein
LCPLLALCLAHVLEEQDAGIFGEPHAPSVMFGVVGSRFTLSSLDPA